MKISALSKYSFINAKLRARISKILPDDLLQQIAKTSSLDEAFVLLRETNFADLEKTYSGTGDLKQVELELLKKQIELYRDVRQYLEPSAGQLVDSLLIKFEIDNIKNAIRVYFNRKIHKSTDKTIVHYLLYETIIYKIPVDLIINAESFDEIAGLCGGTPYGSIINQYSQAVQTSGSLFRMEIAFDHFYYQNLISSINKLDPKDRNITLRLISVEIDLQNISWVIRLKDFYGLTLKEVLAAIIPGGLNLNKAAVEELYNAENFPVALQTSIKYQYPTLSSLMSSQISGSTSLLLLIHQILEEIRKEEVQKILAGYPFNIGIVLVYFILKDEEFRKIRKVLNAKHYGRTVERLKV